MDPSPRSLPISSTPPTTNKRAKRKTRDFDFEPRQEFNLIRQLDSDTIKSLDKAHADLQECVERTVRVQQAFVKKLRKEALNSERVQHILHVIDEIPFHCALQRKILDQTISRILKSKDVEAKRLKVEAEEKRKRDHLEKCTCCECLNW